MARVYQRLGAGEVRINWTALLGLVGVAAVSIGVWGAAIRAGIALLR